MHEVSIMTGILQIVEEETAKYPNQELSEIKVAYGALTNIVADSLSFAFEVLTKNTALENVTLILNEIPVTLTCAKCQKSFCPENNNIYLPCPYCQEEFGHKLEKGRELYIESLTLNDPQ